MKKIDIHPTQKEMVRKLKTNENKLLREFIQAKRIGKFGGKAGEHQIVKYLHHIPLIESWLGKPIQGLTEKDATDFYINLEDDVILRKNGKPYTAEAKNTFLRSLKTYARWLSEEKGLLDYKKVGRWIKPLKEEHNIAALTKEEIELMAANAQQRTQALIWTLFDTGARAQELLNIRLCDIEKVNDTTETYLKITLREEFSKTNGRKISCRMCYPSLAPYLKKRKQEGGREDEPIFKMTYNALRLTIQKAAKKAGIKKKVSPHILRHSAATYYGSFLSDLQLAYRFGWALADSTMVRRYVDRHRILEDSADKAVKQHRMGELQEENERMKLQLEAVQEQMAEMLSRVATIENLKAALMIKREKNV